MVLPGTLFEEMGFNFIGPMDGHDVKALVLTLRNIRKLRGPQFLHVVTRKGKGYAPAEADPIKWHGPGPFDPASGTIFKEKSSGPTYSQVFGQWLCDMAERDPRIIGITPAMREGSGLVEFSKRFPDRYFDVAIAEQHAVTFAAGLAAEGLKPVVAPAQSIAERLDATFVNMRFVKPLDEDLIVALAARHRALVTIEENVTQGGAGSAVGEVLASEGLQLPLLQLGIPDRFIEHGSRDSGLAAAGLDAAGLGGS